MSSLSPNEDARRRSPRKSAGQMPHYLGREDNEHKWGKGVKKLGGGVKIRAKESGSLSDNDSNTSVKPRKKSRGSTGAQKSGGDKPIGVSRRGKGVKVTMPRTGAKGKLTMKYDSDDFSSSDDSTPKATIVKSKSDSVGNHYIKELLKKIKEKDKVIRFVRVSDL